jgi:uncharacterized surface protein with fasciclin (FAS1) repeats
MRHLLSGFVALVALSAALLTGCSKDINTAEEIATETKTIADILRDETQTYQINSNYAARAGNREVKFTLLTYALTKTGLINDLAKAKGNYTLFAPTDDAFRAAGFNSIRDLQNAPNSVLTPILLYHVVGARVLAAQVPEGPNAAVTTLNGADVYLTRKPGPKVYVNGNNVIVADIRAINGVMHAIDKVLMPPSGNIVETVIADTAFTYLEAAVVRASEGTVNVAALLSGNGPFTVFAPTNQAFINAGFPDIASIQAADPADLLPILGYHVIAGRVFSSDLSEGLTPTMFSGGTTTISLNGPTIQGTNNPDPSNITEANIVTTNGVIHVIDRVLLP